MTVATLHAKIAEPWAPRASDVVAAGLTLGALAWAYAPSFAGLVGQWDRDPNYSYGYFVIPIAAVILWSRRGMIDRAKMAPRWWGFLPLLAVLALRYPLFEWNEQYVETATIPLALAGLALAMGGWHLLRVALPSIAFLFFMLPLPPSLNLRMAGPLQRLATAGSLSMLQVLGMPVMAEGNVIVIGDAPLEVARACNGLSMLLSFVTLITATVILVRRPALERVVLLASAVPIALVSNVLRITATALCYYYLGPKAGEKIAHDLAGWAMMPIALVLVWLELRLLSWLFVEVEEFDASALLRRPRGADGGPAGGPATV
jgi:exosortase